MLLTKIIVTFGEDLSKHPNTPLGLSCSGLEKFSVL